MPRRRFTYHPRRGAVMAARRRTPRRDSNMRKCRGFKCRGRAMTGFAGRRRRHVRRRLGDHSRIRPAVTRRTTVNDAGVIHRPDSKR